MASFWRHVEEETIVALALAFLLVLTSLMLTACANPKASEEKSKAETALSSDSWKLNYDKADNLFKQGKYLEEIHLLKSTLPQAEAVEPRSFSYAKYLLRLSKAYVFARQYAFGKQYSLQALEIFNNLPLSEKVSKDWLYDTNYYAGMCFKNLHDENSALTYLNKAVDLSRDSSVHTGDTIDCLHAAIEKIYRNQKKNDKASALHQEKKKTQGLRN
jgi:tetratricopeptide (TPR) repeat protein